MRIYDFKHQLLKNAVENQFIRVEERVDGIAFKKNGMFVIVSIQKELDGNLWVHLSLSRQNRLPTYNDMKFVKDVFIGKDKKAIQVFPESDKHVNLMENCLHLWHCIDNDPLPDFTHGKNTL